MREKDYFKQFDIRFGSLTFGRHQMEVEVNKLFFEKHKNDDIKDGNIQIGITVDRKETMVSLDFDIQGEIISFCDLCLEELVIPVSKHEMLILKTTGDARESDGEDIVFVGEREYSYNIEQIIYEYLLALIPIRKTHQEIGNENCNPDMLKLIEDAKTVSHPKEDERWEALKNLKLK